MKIRIINGPNLNMLGIREPQHYGKETYQDMVDLIAAHCRARGVEPIFYQSNHEGDLVDEIQKAYFDGTDGIVINPGAYTHTSVALLDALKSVQLPAVEVHISRVEDREDFRQVSYVRAACFLTITGRGLNGYLDAVDALLEQLGAGK